MRQHLLVMFGQATTPPETQGQLASLRPTHGWGQTQASQIVKAPTLQARCSIVIAEYRHTRHDARNNTVSQTAAKAFKGEELAGPGGVGCRGEMEVRTRLHSGWQTVSGRVGRKKQDWRQEHATDTKGGMPVRAPAALGEQWGLGWPRTCYLSLGFSRQWSVLTGMPGYQSIPEPQKQAGASGANSLAQNDWLDNKTDRQ